MTEFAPKNIDRAPGIVLTLTVMPLVLAGLSPTWLLFPSNAANMVSPVTHSTLSALQMHPLPFPSESFPPPSAFDTTFKPQSPE
jgi:hypothetical protein